MNPAQRQRLLMIVTLAAVGLYIADLVLITPLGKLWSERSTRIATLRRQVAEGQALIQRERGLRDRWNHLRTNALPQEPSEAEQRLLRACDEWARSSGAQIVDRMPQWKGDEAAYQMLRCRLETSGSLSSLTQFLQRLEDGPLAVKLDSLQLMSRDPAGRQLTLGLQINGLVLNTPAKP
jgi:Tfp pilus assembly protein PilO